MRFILLVTVLLAPAAWAFPWMVKHNYGSCAVCHVDPSGSGQLTPYGRAQADVIVRWRTQPRNDEEEVPKSANFLWFLELPEFLNLSGNARGGALIRPSPTTPVIPLIMAADLYATVNIGPVVGHVTTGVGVKNAGPAGILPQCSGQCNAQWTAREFWVGAKFAEEAVMVRAGRINLPFGLRNNEHTSFVRQTTRTDVNTSQSVGASVSYNSDVVRGEVMGLLGNFQLGPDIYRERGYSAFAEYSLSHNAYIGLSSLIAHAGADPETTKATTRHAHGMFARLAPTQKFAILAEADFLLWQSPQLLDRIGFAAMAQGDFEIMNGLHLMLMLEGQHKGAGQMGPELGAWVSGAWYFLPHVELRFDHILRRRSIAGVNPFFEYNFVIQLHFFL
ncbi:MAG: hypothetical protein JNM17_11715 [Archangium sp.]|nr:hypothetical protein [Archangium sp.]